MKNEPEPSSKRRYSLGWLALLGVASLACTLLSTIPFMTCPTCRGLEKHLLQARMDRTSGDGFNLNCPECSDSGLVTGVKSLRGSRLDGRADAVLRSLRDPGKGNRAFAVAVSCKDLEGFMHEFKTREALIWTTFVRAEGRDHLVVLMESSWMTSEASLGAALLPLDGNKADYVQMDCDDWMDLKGKILNQEDPDGAFIRVDVDTNGFRTEWKEKISYEIRFLDDGLRPRAGYLPLPTPPQGVCRLAIRGGRWHILTPTFPRGK